MRERRTEIKRQIQALRDELEQLKVAEDALADKMPKTLQQSLQKPKDLPTIKDMVLEVLKGYPEGARANEILTAIELLYGSKIARESLSPQLTRLQNDDRKITLTGRKWRLVEAKHPQTALASEDV